MKILNVNLNKQRKEMESKWELKEMEDSFKAYWSVVNGTNNFISQEKTIKDNAAIKDSQKSIRLYNINKTIIKAKAPELTDYYDTALVSVDTNGSEGVIKGITKVNGDIKVMFMKQTKEHNVMLLALALTKNSSVEISVEKTNQVITIFRSAKGIFFKTKTVNKLDDIHLIQRTNSTRSLVIRNKERYEKEISNRLMKFIICIGSLEELETNKKVKPAIEHLQTDSLIIEGFTLEECVKFDELIQQVANKTRALEIVKKYVVENNPESDREEKAK